MAIMAITAVIGMSSCSKGNDNGGDTARNGEMTSVSIVLSEGTTRAVAAPEEAKAVNFKSGYVLFTNSLGIINKVTEITDTELAADDPARATGAKIWINDMKEVNKGGEIKNVPAAATTVYIVGNLPSGVTAPFLAEDISNVKDRVISVASQSNAAGSVADVTLYGDGAAIQATHPDVSISARYAKIDVNAIAARIEVGAVSYSNLQTNLITGFQIDGIFINYYYPEMSLASEVSTALINNAPANNTLANSVYTTASGGAYNSAAASILCDFDLDGLGYDVNGISKSAADLTATDPEDNNVWAYNVLAPVSEDGTVVTELEAPHVIIRLSNITTRDPGKVYPATQYLTVREFREAGTPNVISEFKPGYIYFITNLTFDESNLTDVPEQDAVTVYVEAKLMTWSRQGVDWGF